MEKIKLLFVAIFIFLLCGPVLDVQANGKKGKKRKEMAISTVLEHAAPATAVSAVVLRCVETNDEQVNKINKLKRYNSNLTGATTSLLEKNKLLIEKNSALKTNNEELEKRLQDITGANAVIHEGEKRKKTSGSMQNMTALRANLEKFQKENSELKKKLAQSQKKLAAANDASLSYLRDLGTVSKTRDMASQTLSQTEKSYRSSAETLANTQSQLKRAHDELEQAHAKQHLLNEENTTLKSTVITTKKLLDNERAAHQKITAKCAVLEKRLQVHEEATKEPFNIIGADFIED